MDAMLTTKVGTMRRREQVRGRTGGIWSAKPFWWTWILQWWWRRRAILVKEVVHDKDGHEHFYEDGEEGFIEDEKVDNEPDLEASHHSCSNNIEDPDRQQPAL